MRKVASADNRLSPSRNLFLTGLEHDVADQSNRNFFIPAKLAPFDDGLDD